MLQNTPIHLLYVPTIYCNLGCRYCYLGELTDTKLLKTDNQRALETIEFAVNKFLNADVLPFNISLHGGEVSTLQPNTLSELFQFISNYYNQHQTELDELGFNKRNPHIKTNLYNFDKQYELFLENKVSISASIDLPLSAHASYRRTKSGKSTLSKTLQNLQLLAGYPHRKKFSSTLYHTHLQNIDELIRDIWHIHREVGYDMNYYNFMFGFESEFCKEKFDNETLTELRPLNEDEQVQFYERMKLEFTGTELEVGLQKHWFEEFTPSFCTNSTNCGEKFFLLQSDGDIFSCVRGQGVKEFRYGNIFTDSVETILRNAKNSIKTIINKAGMHADCKACDYLHLCKTGCPFVKFQQNHNSKSYTCKLQKAIYRDNPLLYPPAVAAQKPAFLYDYMHSNHPQLLFDTPNATSTEVYLPNDWEDQKNKLPAIIDHDTVLQELFNTTNFYLVHNKKHISLESQLLKPKRQVLLLSAQSNLLLYIRKTVFLANSKELIRNSLHLQMLRDTKVVYGDEQRTKQEHTFTQQIYYNILRDNQQNTETHFVINLMPTLLSFQETYREKVLNNLFFTTSALRNYHYQKQKENGFYHIQALNLPFQNLEFFWLKNTD